MKDILWVERYRPNRVADVILPERYKVPFQKMVDTGEIPNLLLVSSSGMGKTTIARAMCDEIGCSSMLINGSLDGTKDTLRNEIKDFVSSMAMRGGRKYVILDEADGLSHQMQPAFRTFMEEFSKNAGFILTCNHQHRIIPALHSRVSTVEFRFTREEKTEMMKATIKRVMEILKLESVKFEPKAVASLVSKHFPDIRKCLNELQKYSSNGKIDSGILIDVDEVTLKKLLDGMKAKNFDAMRTWITETDMDQQTVFDKLYDISRTLWTPAGAAQAVIILAEYQEKAAVARNPDINLAAALIELSMMEWKP